MKGQTNAVQTLLVGDILNLKLVTNLSSHEDLIGAVITIDYGIVKTFVWNGEEITLTIPQNNNYTITVSDVVGYKTPHSHTYTSLIGNVNNVELQYTTLLLEVNVGGADDYEIYIAKKVKYGKNNLYTKVDYIEATGTLYIDTEFKPNQNTRVVMDVQCLLDGNNYFLFGARTNNSNNNANALTYGFSAYNTCYRSHYYNGWKDFSTSITFTDRFILDKNKNVTNLNLNQISHTYTEFQSAYNMYLFAANTAGTAGTFGKAKLYSCQIYDNDTLIRNFIPVVSSSNMVGLYDTINDVFYTSRGSENFIAGDISYEVIETQTILNKSYKIPYDTEYKVTASVLSGYKTPEAQIYMANTSTRVIDMIYQEVYYGVYIAAESGNYYTADTWNANETAVGYLIIHENGLFILGLENIGEVGYAYSKYPTEDIPGITTCDTEAKALLDFNGESNTNAIIDYVGTSSIYNYTTFAEICRKWPIQYGDKILDGYLLSAGEHGVLSANSNAIVACSEKIGLGIDYLIPELAILYTSSEADASNCWTTGHGMGDFIATFAARSKESWSKSADCSALIGYNPNQTERALTSFRLTNVYNSNRNYKCVPNTTWLDWINSSYNTGDLLNGKIEYLTSNNNVYHSYGDRYRIYNDETLTEPTLVTDTIISGHLYYCLSMAPA